MYRPSNRAEMTVFMDSSDKNIRISCIRTDNMKILSELYRDLN